MLAIFIFIIILLVLLGAITALSLVGYRLNLFSSKFLAQYVPFKLVRFLMFSSTGFVWILGKIHFPGVEMSVTYGFDNRAGHAMRAAYWKSRVGRLGQDVHIDVGAKAMGWEKIFIGDNCWIDRNVFLENGSVDKTQGLVYVKNTTTKVSEGELIIGRGCHISKNVVIASAGGVFIGDFTGIASGAKIYSLSHHYKNMTADDGIVYKFTPCADPKEQSLIQGPVVFEGNNALGLNSVVLPGVTIHKNSWVGVCSYVVDDIPPDCLAMGCPAKVVKTIVKRQSA